MVVAFSELTLHFLPSLREDVLDLTWAFDSGIAISILLPHPSACFLVR